jgi:hypothetical protein
MNETTDFAWVIEKNDGGGLPPEYWTGHSPESFSVKNDEAIRFARKQDAIAVLHWILSDKGRAFCHVREHGWGLK